MCLITTKNIPEIAQEDIVCYKFYVLHKVKDDINSPYDKDKYLSPYRGVPAPNINEVANTELDKAYLCDSNTSNLKYFVMKGFHSYKYLDDLIKELSFWLSYDTMIFKCIIPKGTKYYEGTFDGSSSYCSESIILKEAIDVE